MLIPPEIRRMYDLLVSFLGDSKSELDDSMQLQFSCPRCIDRDGIQESNKFHLEVNLANGYFNCWKCSSMDDEMHGTVYKLIRRYGNEQILKEYKDAIHQFKMSSLYKIHYGEDYFKDDYADIEKDTLSLPKGIMRFCKGKCENTRAFRYLSERGIDWDIIDRFNLSYTAYDKDNTSISNRIIIPSYDEFGNLNYWTGRDFTGNKKRQRYFNPKVERKNVIFNEELIQWNADITLVEGPFDHIVVPNSIPLLGKALDEDYRLFSVIRKKAMAKINIFLDCDAKETALALYIRLNTGELRDRVKFIEVVKDERDLDPSKIFQIWGRKGIIQFLRSARTLKTLL